MKKRLPLLIVALLAACAGKAQDLLIAAVYEGSMRFIPYDSTAFVHDANGNIIEQAHYFAYPPTPVFLASRIFNTYDANEMMTERLHVNYDNDLPTDSYRMVYTYNTAGRTLTNTTYYKNYFDTEWRVTAADTSVYQSDTILVKGTNWTMSGSEVYGFRHVHYVDAMGRDTLMVSERWWDHLNDWRLIERSHTGYSSLADTTITVNTVSSWDTTAQEWLTHTRYTRHYLTDTMVFYNWEQWQNNQWERRAEQREIYDAQRKRTEYYYKMYNAGQVSYAQRETYVYNNQGDLDVATSYNWLTNNWRPQTRRTYTYENGKAVKIEAEQYLSNIWTPGSIVEFGYVNDLMVFQRNTSWDANQNKYVLQLFDTLLYDIHDNLILRRSITQHDTSEERYYYNFIVGIAKAPLLEVSVYPNPFRDKLMVQIPSAAGTQVSLQLYDLNGRSVMNQTLRSASDNPIEISTTGLPTGVFLLRIATGTGTHTQRVVHVK